ncbi:MAG TPA: hypothetical protein VLK58_01610 [Conexibacter sp.]|nr:hypothetical protein [Conexibacter sp.]
MRSERATAGRARALLLLLLVAVASALALATAPAASAALRLPPAAIARWPEPSVCGQSGFIVDTDARQYCEVKRRCDELSGGDSDYAHMKDWCAVVKEGLWLKSCGDLLAAGTEGPMCAADRKKLAKRCPKRPPAIAPGPQPWLCEQYYLTYKPAVKPQEPPAAPSPPPPPADAPPASTTPAAPPPTDGGAPAPPAEDGGGTGSDAGDEDEEDLRGEGESVPDVFSALGARSPMCNRPSQLPPTARERCKTSGSIVHAYPLSHYGLDVHVAAGADAAYELPVEELIANGMASAIQHVAGLWWMLIVFLVKGVLLLLEWSFEIPLIVDCRDNATAGACESAMPQVAAGMRDLHENVLGRGWLAAAMAAAGIWGLWHGMVRRRTAETFSGLAATLALMIAGIVIVYNPAGTIGEVARISNDAALGVLATPTAFDRDPEAEGFAGAQASLFDTLVKRPWCALQFGDVDYCMRPRGEGKPSVADVWLSFDSGSIDRESLFKMTKGERVSNGWGAKAGDALKAFGNDVIFGFGDAAEDNPDPWGDRDRAAAVQDRLKAVVGDGSSPEKVHLQQAAGTPQRVALLVLVALAQLGAIAVLIWIALRLVMSSVMAVILLLLVPLVLLCASLGEGGRRACLGHGLRLLAALAARFLFAFILMIVLFVSGVLSSLAIGWFAVWLLQIAFWFGLVFQRGRLLAYAQLQPAGTAGGAGGGAGGGMGLMQLAYGYQGLRMMGSELAGAVSSPLRALRASRALTEQAQRATVKDGVSSRLRRAARGALQRGRESDRQRAERLLGRKAALQKQLDGARRVRGDLERAHGSGGATSGTARADALRAERDVLAGRRDALRERTAAHRRAMAASGQRIRRLDQQRGLLTQGRHARAAAGDGSRSRELAARRGAIEFEQRRAQFAKAQAEQDLGTMPRLRETFEQGRDGALESGHPRLAATYEQKLADLAERETAARATIAGADATIAAGGTEMARIDADLTRAHALGDGSRVQALDDKLVEIDAEREQERGTWLAAEDGWRRDSIALADAEAAFAEASSPEGQSAMFDRYNDESSDAMQEIERAKLEERRIEAEMQSPEMRWAENVMVGDQDGREPSAAEIDRWIADRRLAVETDADPVARPQLEAAGFTEDQYAHASAAEQETMRRQSVAAMEEFRRLAHVESAEHVPAAVVRAEAQEARRNDPDRYARDYMRNAGEAREQRRRERELRRRSR